MVLYRKYRPQKLADLVGHDNIKKTLLSQLESGRISHGYLFYGPKGTGKTSTARILAKAVNCQRLASSGSASSKKEKDYTLNANKLDAKFSEPCNKCAVCISITDGSYLDLVEIDAASNRGIDEIRDLREKIKLSPINGRFKVYIIDEAHMLTNEAFNALLKTLEEPPQHAIFILCTTEVGKLPATIVSRLTRFNFRRAGKGDLEQVLVKIAKAEKINIDREATSQIAEAADGSFRDAVSILDQISAKSGKIGVLQVETLAAQAGFGKVKKFIDFIAMGNLKEAVLFVEDLAESGADISNFVRSAILFLEKLLFVKIGAVGNMFDDFNESEVGQIRQLAGEFRGEELVNLMRLLLISESEIKLYPLPQIPLILTLFKYLAPDDNKNAGEEDVQKVVVEKAAEASNVPELSKVREVSKGTDVKGTQDDRKVKVKADSKLKSVSLARIENRWGDFLSQVKKENIHVPALLRSTKTLSFEGESLTLEVFYRFHKDKLEEPKIIRMLDEKISKVMGVGIKFKFVLAKREAKPPVAVTRSNVVDIKEEDLAQIAQEIFSK